MMIMVAVVGADSMGSTGGDRQRSVEETPHRHDPGEFLANVNVSSRSLYAIARPSVV